jgi:hypothetical protein
MGKLALGDEPCADRSIADAKAYAVPIAPGRSYLIHNIKNNI